nr:MAG TPA: hypothetical protein [Caudoviricetes sp.]
MWRFLLALIYFNYFSYILTTKLKIFDFNTSSRGQY